MRQDRVHVLGDSPYEHERVALDFLIGALPDTEPYRLWALFELLEAQNGALYEIDALVLGYQALYLVEIKSHPGTLSGDDVDWVWAPYDDPGRTVWLRNPLATTNHKCKVLVSQLKRLVPESVRVPRVEPLVFLSAEPAKLKLAFSERGAVRVVTRGNVVQAITRHVFPGSPPGTGQRINVPAVNAIETALKRLGVRARKRRMRAGQYELGALIDTGPGFQDREATHLVLGDRRSAIARTFLVSEQVSDERRRKLHAAAKREFSLLLDVGSHPSIVKPIDLVADADLGPTLLLEDTRKARPLSQLLRAESSARGGASEPIEPLSFDERASILLQVARALAFCHRRQVRHGALSPDAVLIERHVHAEPGVFLRNFFLGASAEVSGTMLSTQLLSSSWQLYQAPECARGAEPTEASDVFSLGALAYHLLVGRPAAASVIEQLKLLQAAEFLDVTAATDEVQDDLAQLVMEATSLSPVQRAITAEQFANRLEEALTRPPAVADATAEPDPLSARKDDVIAGRYRVEGVRGQGASARVLAVRDDETGKQLALKIALDADHDERLEREAELLCELDHSRIVRFDRSFVVSGRRCLTMSLAGEHTLADLLREEGAPSLDFAQRYGDELLDALRYLEQDAQKLHRDIKPANIGVGALGKQAHHLTLFDFSLASAPLDATQVGTAAYRDPQLDLRGRWDYAADRYAAAVTLYEMLTGVRPTHADITRPVEIEADRFDPAVKDGLASFFRIAFERDVDARHPSAEDMRRQWISAFDERVNRLLAGRRSARPGAAVSTQQVESAEYDDAQLVALALDAPVELLRLTPAAKSALARAGMFQAGEILALPNNRLVAMRGVGRAVSEEIARFRERWNALRPSATTTSEPFVAEVGGEPLPLGSDVLGLADSAIQVLEDAGLTDTRALAAAPRAQVEALLARAGESADRVRARLEQQAESARAEGQSLPGLVEELLGGKGKAAQQVRVWWGLAGSLEGRLDATPSEAAEALGVKPAALHVSLGQLREKWSEHPRRDALEARVEQVARSVQRAAPLAQVAEALAADLVGGGVGDAAAQRARVEAAALVRVVAELQRDDDAGLRLVRARGERAYWLTDAEDTLELLRALGDRADVIASRNPLASPAAALRELRGVLPEREGEGPGETHLAGLDDQRLLRLACAWSETAALSARLELYPRALDPARALALCVTALDSDPSIEDIKRRVTGRFATVVLPEGEALDALLEAQGFEWSPERARYVRPSAGGVSDPGTRLAHTVSRNDEPRREVESAQAALEGSGAEVTPPEQTSPTTRGGWSPAAPLRRESDFVRSLRSAVERGGMRVITVSAKSLREAERVLARRLRTEVVALDEALSRAMHALEPEQTEVMYEIDAAGADSVEWTDLTELAKGAAERVAEELCRGEGVKLLSRPGLCARYGLADFLARLRSYAEGDERASVLLLVPTVGSAGGVPRIEDHYAIPGLSPQHVLRMHHQDLSALGAA